MVEKTQKEMMKETLALLEEHKIVIDNRALDLIIGEGENYVRSLQYQILEFAKQTQEDFLAYAVGEKKVLVPMEKLERTKKRKTQEEDEIQECIISNSKGIERVDIPHFAECILNKFNFKTIYGSKGERVYIYQNGIYTLKGEEVIKTFSEEKLSNACKNNTILEIIGKVKRKTAISFEDFEKIPIHLIPLENGVYNLSSEKLEEHNPKRYFKFKLPVVFDEKALCPKFMKFIEDMLYEDDLKLIQEWFGFCLYRKYFIKKGMIWFGETDTGKTTLINILESLMGKEKNCSGLSLHEISSGDRFALKNLHNKHLNSYDDLSSKDIGDGGGFKIATGGGSITAEHKFGDIFKFMNFSKLLFACNNIPSPKNIDDNAYFSRWFPLAFDNQIAEEDQKKQLAEELEKELSGILNWAIEGLQRLLVNKRFTFNKNPNEVKAIMCRFGNPIYAFVEHKCKEQEGFWISKQDLYEEYCKYMRAEKLPIMTKDKFSKNVLRFCNYMVDSKKGNDRGWRNIRVDGYVYEKIGEKSQAEL